MDPFTLNLIMIIGFVIGSGLIIVEAFIPGFGVAGICGVVLEIVALRCCWLLHGTVPTLLALAGILLLIGLAVFLSYRSAMNGRLSKSRYFTLKARPHEEGGRPGQSDRGSQICERPEAEELSYGEGRACDDRERPRPVHRYVRGGEGSGSREDCNLF